MDTINQNGRSERQHNMNLENQICISPQQAAAELGISRGLVYRLLAEGTLPAVRLGRRLVIPVAALEALLKGSTAGGEPHVKT